MKRLVATLLVLVLASCTAFHPPAAYLPSRNGIQAGETITVQGNENIYTIAHEHNVSMRELIVLNDLKPPFEVRPGQSLILPAGGGSFSGDMQAPSPAPLTPVDRNVINPIEPGAVTTQPLEPLAPLSVTPKAPASAVTPTSSPAPLQPATVSKAAAPSSTLSEPVQALNRPLPPQKQTVTTMSAPATPPASATAASSVAMVWPVQGPILSGFGPKGPGLNNDGVNIGAPKGAPVVSAAPGTVVYAGNEMKGFGNLVLIRHQGDWVTAYAHLDRVLVKKDSIVGQGDMIGTVGKTGDVTSPQLHFETRKGGKPVDPAGVVTANP